MNPSTCSFGKDEIALIHTFEGTRKDNQSWGMTTKTNQKWDQDIIWHKSTPTNGVGEHKGRSSKIPKWISLWEFENFKCF